MTTRARERDNGVKELIELDLFEISIVPTPANPDTRFLSMNGETARTGDFDFIFAGLKVAASKSVSRKSTKPIRFASFVV